MLCIHGWFYVEDEFLLERGSGRLFRGLKPHVVRPTAEPVLFPCSKLPGVDGGKNQFANDFAAHEEQLVVVQEPEAAARCTREGTRRDEIVALIVEASRSRGASRLSTFPISVALSHRLLNDYGLHVE